MTTLPLTPQAGTGVTRIVDFALYQRITGDTTSLQADVEESLDSAINDACNECKRTLAYGQYKEVQYLYKNGMVFPSATPIDNSMPILSGTDNIFDPLVDTNPSTLIQGQGVWVGWFSPLPWMPVFSGVLPPQTDVEYWGGYTVDTIPYKLARAIASMAFYDLHPYFMTNVPGGLSSMSVGGVSISSKSGFSSGLYQDTQIKKILRRFRHPQVRPWQS